MIQSLGEWVRTMAVGAIFCAVVLLLIPEGSEKRSVKLTCALMLTILLIQPLRCLDEEKLTKLLTLRRLEETGLAADTDELSMELYSRIIRRETEEYIWDAAQRLGIRKLGVRIRLKDSDGMPVPWSIDLTGSVTQQQKEALSLLLEGELGIPPQRQTWSLDDAG